jgi:hypothetical protein
MNLNTHICTDAKKIAITQALADAHRLINDDKVAIEIRDVLFSLSRVIVDLVVERHEI